MVFDWDDAWPGHDRLDLLTALHDLRPDFRATIFAPPGRAPDFYWDAFPDWLELAVHGWLHSPMECAEWTGDDVEFVIHHRPARFVHGFKAPFWALSDAAYGALAAHGWWVADHSANDAQRPVGAYSHVLDVGSDHWHGHIGNDCGNGIEETWDHVVALVREAPSFEFVSEAVTPWRPKVLA